ncbi:MAG: S46 family peptidase, partial [Deltaproteobacteria bacterium]|nr:S46 family peptidase [Deltaproteobacteria bacterium]
MKVMSSLLTIIAAMLFSGSIVAEEGMWTFDNPPLKALSKKYGFVPDAKWLEHVRLSVVRFRDGGSGSFVSPNGLVLTNHHVAVGQLQKMSDKKHDYVKKGFYARVYKDEIKCPDLELNKLESMKEVTSRIMSVAKGKTGEDAIKARRAEQARISKEAEDKTGLECEVVDFYQGGEYWLYCYKKYTDVRLVFAPERQAAYFGGDHDNFTYPRYDLDFSLFRVYENGKPIHPKHYLKWNTRGAKKGELVFIVGHPGRTQRLYTTEELEMDRDESFPLKIDYFNRSIRAMEDYSKRGKEEKRRALVRIFYLRNSKKAYGGMYKTIKDPSFMKRRRKAESAFRNAVYSNPKLRETYGDPWADISRVLKKNKGEITRRVLHHLWGSNLASKAITIVKLVGELEKPDSQRLDGFHDSQLARVKFELFSPAPLYRDLEAVTLETSLEFAKAHLPKGDPFLQVIDGLGDIEKAATELTSGTRLVDPAFRRKLVKGGTKAVEECKDPLIVLARKLVPIMVADEHWTKRNVESVITPAREKIGRARFAVYGKDTYPDATFTLRMTYGTVRGYPMNGTLAPYKTTLYGLFDRALGFDKLGEWSLPARFWKKRKRLDLSTPVNFVSDCDIIGGNSGSPVIDRKARLVGLVFDGNIESLAGRYFFDPTANRAVSVHSAYIIEALKKLYGARKLVKELE